MATSATSAFNLDLNDIIEEAFERAGTELRTGYDFRTARRSLNLMFAEWANRGINLWTVEQGQINLVSGTATYDLPLDTVDLIEHVIRTNAGSSNQSDIAISRIALPTYASIPNKTSTGRPIQVYIDRKTGAVAADAVVQYPTITVWPTPDSAMSYQLVYWRLRRMLDAGNGVNTQDIPFRFLPCLVAGLAYYIAMKIPDSAPRIVPLKQMYDEAWELAADEDRDRSSITVAPRRAYV
jgi:hypothetical protein